MGGWCRGVGSGVIPGPHFPGCGSGHMSSAGGPSEGSVHSLPGVSGGDSPQALLTQLPFRVLLPRDKEGKRRARGGSPGWKMERKCSSTFLPGPEGSVLKPHMQGGGWRAHGSPESRNARQNLDEAPGARWRRGGERRTKSWRCTPWRPLLCPVQSSGPRSPHAGPAGRLPAAPGTHREPSCTAGSCYLCTMSLISFTELRSLLKS